MNPILPIKYYTPDVEARVFDNKIYLYGSNDIPNHDAYCSYHYNVFSSEDMVNWEAYENVFYKDDLVDDNGLKKPLFAPDCEYINGKYCLFYCTKGKGEGVAFSDTPYGKFTDEQVIKTADGDGIDPSVLVEGDKVYYFWGQGQLRGAMLNDNLDDIVKDSLTVPLLTNKDDAFHEGSSIRKIGELYYMVYACHARDNKPTCLGYALSKNPLGPYEKKGIIIDNVGCDPNSWNNHGSIQQFNGQWYIFYHRSSNNSYFSRRVCVEPITINPDGTIDEVEMTTQGAEKPIDAKFCFGAEHFCLLGGNARVKSYIDSNVCYNYLSEIHSGDFAVLKYIDFSKSNVNKVSVKLACNTYSGEVSVHLDTLDSKPVANISFKTTLGEFDFAKFSAKLNCIIDGTHAVYLKFNSDFQGTIASVKSFGFEEK